MKPGIWLSPSEVRREGFSALCDSLGVAGAFEYLRQLLPGRGNYTAERTRLIADEKLPAIAARIKQARRRSRRPSGSAT